MAIKNPEGENYSLQVTGTFFLQFWLKTHFASTTFLDFHVCQSGRGSTNSIMHISNVSREQILHFGVNYQKYQAVAPGKQSP